MLKKILESENLGKWILLHAAIGILSSFSSLFFALWFFVFLLSSLSFISKGTARMRKVNLLYFISYLAATELIVRMSKGWMYKIPWEFGKYVMIFGFLYGVIANNSRKGIIGLFLIVLLLPSLFLGPHTTPDFRELVGNIFGPLAIGIGVLYSYKLNVTKDEFKKILFLILLPCASVLAFTLIKNPDFSSYKFELGANFATAGGFGSNQVSTVLGLGMFLTFIFWINKWTLFKNRSYTLVLLLLFAIQGLLTFSRGGMIGAFIGIITITWVYGKVGAKDKLQFKVPQIGKFIVMASFAVVLSFFIANALTGGILELRYKGETNATLRGTREKDLNVLTTNRYDIFKADLELWQDYFVLGTGVGGSKMMRSFEYGDIGHAGVAAHVELSRLLAEHGFLGLIYFLLILFLGSKVYFEKGDPLYKAAKLAMYVLALYTTFHAATRTFITPLLISLSTLSIIEQNTSSNKPTKPIVS